MANSGGIASAPHADILGVHGAGSNVGHGAETIAGLDG